MTFPSTQWQGLGALMAQTLIGVFTDLAEQSNGIRSIRILEGSGRDRKLVNSEDEDLSSVTVRLTFKRLIFRLSHSSRKKYCCKKHQKETKSVNKKCLKNLSCFKGHSLLLDHLVEDECDLGC